MRKGEIPTLPESPRIAQDPTLPEGEQTIAQGETLGSSPRVHVASPTAGRISYDLATEESTGHYDGVADWVLFAVYCDSAGRKSE
jgi:hypothetical protein